MIFTTPYLSAAEYATREGITVEAARKRLRAGKVDGVVRIGRAGYWRIPNPDYVNPAPVDTVVAAAVVRQSPFTIATELIGALEANGTRSARTASMAVSRAYLLVERHRSTKAGHCDACLGPWPCDAADTGLAILDRAAVIMSGGGRWS